MIELTIIFILKVFKHHFQFLSFIILIGVQFILLLLLKLIITSFPNLIMAIITT